MPLTVSKLTGATVQGKIRIKVPGEPGDGEELAVTYKPGILTAALENELSAYGQRSEGWADLVSRLVVSWELTGEDGNPYPLQKEALMALPGWMLQAVVFGIREDLSPNSKTIGETSAASS